MRKTHPALIHANEIIEICNPLHKLNISYFSHVNIDQAGKFSAASNNPEFHKHYIKQNYYHADIHLSKIGDFTNYVIWDALECDGAAKQMNEDADQFKIRHTFTIIDKNATSANYYHFSTHIKENSFNQVYLSNLDLLEMFVKHFNASMNQAKHLRAAYDYKYAIEDNTANFNILDGGINSISPSPRTEFMREITRPNVLSLSDSKRLMKSEVFLIHKDTYQPVPLYKQQLKCLQLLIAGCTARETAYRMNLSYRTINHYLENLRIKLGCRNSKELIAAYSSQIMRFR